jgi:hypothetical protein
MRYVQGYLSRSVPEKNIAIANSNRLSLRKRTSFFTPDPSFMTQSELY